MFEKMGLKRKLFKSGYPWMSISMDAIQDYQQQVAIFDDNQQDIWTMERKINRDWYLGTTTALKDGVVKKCYGNLELVYDLDAKSIIKINNKKGWHRGYFVNAIDKKILNELYQL